MNIFNSLRIYAGKWEVKETRDFTDEEKAAISQAVVVSSQFGSSVQFTMTANALTYKLETYRSKTFNANNGNFEDFYLSPFFNDLSAFLSKYLEWLNEMKDNKRSLDLFNLSCGDKPFDLVTGVKPKKIFSKFSDYSLVTVRLNSAIKNCKSKGAENKFLEMFYIGTERLVSEKLKY